MLCKRRISPTLSDFQITMRFLLFFFFSLCSLFDIMPVSRCFLLVSSVFSSDIPLLGCLALLSHKY